MKKIIIFLCFLFLLWCSDSNTKNNSNTQNSSNTNTWVILALWDSITAWYWVDRQDNYPSMLEKKLSNNWFNYKVINAWVSWDTSKQLKERADLYLDKNPDIVILVIWWNDWLRGMSLEDMKNNISDIIDIYWNKTIVLWWMDIPINLWLKYRSEFKDVYTQLAKEKKDIYFIPFFLKDVAWKSSFNLPDRIHPNKDWYNIVVDNLYDFLLDNNLLKK